MAQAEQPENPDPSDGGSEERSLNPLAAAALFGGAVAATAGAYFGTRALARKNREKDGRPINSVMATAITACDLARPKDKVGASPAPQVSPASPRKS